MIKSVQVIFNKHYAMLNIFGLSKREVNYGWTSLYFTLKFRKQPRK